ncbi:20-hydroxyecdysone protein [Drosophila sulfurigaster albostrigata]|uniref:20-hydroxyecdysone protein n=1 Tax=Drosophila sulfurigaster albostrigata TaxID=89887 RepID=UPI002D21B5B1|nr:20-hydroxyecdysone protein [Drosophila sulfurigaster albostrigata]
MKPVALVLLCLAVACQGRVLLPKEPLDSIPVTIVSESEPQALPLVKEQTAELPLKVEEVKPAARLETQEEVQTVVKEEVKPAEEQAKPELKETAKPEEAKPELKEAAKPEEAKPELKEEIKSELPAEEKPLIKEEAQPELKEEAKPELKKEAREEVAEIKAEEQPEQQLRSEQPSEIKAEVQTEAKPETQPELKTELKPEQPEAQPETQPEAQPQIQPDSQLKSQPETQPEVQPAAPVETESSPILKALANSADDVVVAPEVVVDPAEVNADGVQPHVRQATQATPTQSSTQQNFVQQLIQNSPIGQFLSQFNNGQQQQQQQQQGVQQDNAEQPATPAPTIPGFLNPSAAITSAQNAVQNAAQSVVNTTTQAFQGIQQFANNLGTQFQNTLSGLTGQQQQNAQPTTARPPGPIQSFVNNVFGGNNNATAASPAQQQQQGPLQGIINFLGGNRPTSAPAAAAPAAAAAAPAQTPGVDDKIEAASDQQASIAENEVRTSAEAIDDSFEEAVPSNEVITVNDDASSAGDDAVPNNSVDSEQQNTFVDSAVAL